MFFKEIASGPGANLVQLRKLEIFDSENKRLIEELKIHQAELENQNDELKRSEYRLNGLSKRFADLYNFAPIAYLTLSCTGEIRELNLKASSCLGTSRREIFGKPFSAFVVPRSCTLFQQHLRNCLNSFQSIRTTLELIDFDDRVFEAELESIACRDEQGGDVLIRSMLRDVTDSKAAERELKAAKEKAEAASVAKSQFLANMSHELRTPIGVILGFADLLADQASDSDDKGLQQGLNTIQRNGKHLLNLIDDLLDIAKVEAGRMDLELTSINLETELAEIIKPFRIKCLEKDVVLDLSTSSDLPAPFVTDLHRFRQILLNILSNAFKFTEQGLVSVDAFVMKDHRSRNQCFCIDVKDSGCGISDEHAALLFKPFTQADSSFSRRFGGNGLGLSLARQLAEAMGGGLDLLKSEIGKGSTFRIKFSTELTPSAQKQKDSIDGETSPAVAEDLSVFPLDPNAGSLIGLKVLVVEDAVDNRLIISKFLEHAGAFVECAEDGQIAVDCASSNEYDVVLMDLRLPVLDGYRASSILRERGLETPIIALSADIKEENDPIADNKDFDAYLTKPINWQKLAGTILRCQSKRRQMH